MLWRALPLHHQSALLMITQVLFDHLLCVSPRFWHSTAAYAIATAVSGPVSSLPAQGSEVYRWPGDLFQPSLVVVLTLDPEERKRRLRGRGLAKTEEEQELDHNQLFRLK